MWSRRFALAKQDNPALAELLTRLEAYISHQLGIGQKFVLPRLAGAALGINSGEAYVLLELLVSVKVLKPVFNVYCKTSNVLLATVHSEEKLKDVPRCDECDREHLSSELRLEIGFEPYAEGKSLEEAA